MGNRPHIPYLSLVGSQNAESAGEAKTLGIKTHN